MQKSLTSLVATVRSQVEVHKKAGDDIGKAAEVASGAAVAAGEIVKQAADAASKLAGPKKD